MLLKKTIVLIISGILLFTGFAPAQDPYPAIPAGFDLYAKKHLQEKIFVHTDKSFYLAGEICWFKVYNVDGERHRPIDMSKIAYVEILDKDNKPVMQAKIELKQGKGDGSFFLPLSVQSGHYHLRAYTNWMKNYAADFYFEKPLTIVNSLKTFTLPEADTSMRYYAAFFPEGGNLVNGLESKVAFQITDKYGKGVDCKGYVLNGHNDTVASFQPFKFGLGHFMFTPQGNEQYKALITFSNGYQFLQNFPAVYEKGYVMQLRETSPDVIQVSITAKSLADAPVFLFVHSRQEIKIAERQTLSNGTVTFTIDKNKLADGLSHLTLFDAQQQPVCERLYFKQPAQVLSVSAASNAHQYGTRKRVGITVNTQLTGTQNPAAADLSLAVYRIDSLQTIDASNILTYLWLTSDLKGNIESPEYYFSAGTSEVKEATDNLVLVHGWRRFNWNDVLNKTAFSFEYMPECVGHVITCKITNAGTGSPAGDINAFLSVPGTTLQFYNAKTDAEGKTSFDVRDFYGPNEMVIQTDAIDSNFRIEAVNPFSEKYAIHPLPPLTLSPKAIQTLNEHHIGMQVVNTFDGSKLSRFEAPVVDTVPFYGKPFKKYMLDDYTRFSTIEEVLREYVPEVAVRRWGGHLHLKVFNFEVKDFYPSDPLILLDGVWVNNQTIMGYDPLKVNKLEVVTDRYIKGEFSYNGIVSFTTYHGDMQDLKLDPKAVILDYEGLQLKREFYSPVYKTDQQASGRQPDFRNLLYWAPGIHTGANGEAAVEFYTSDIKGKYVAVLQGMDDKGNAGSYYFTFDVNGR